MGSPFVSSLYDVTRLCIYLFEAVQPLRLSDDFRAATIG